MTAVEKLVAFVENLTEEQVDKIIRQMPRLSALLVEALQPCPPEQTSQNQ